MNSRGRREFLRLGVLGAACAVAPGVSLAGLAPAEDRERALDFYNLHTGEALHAVYWAEGAYVRQSLSEINHILRDHRTNEVNPIDVALLDLLHRIRSGLDTTASIHVISGYRSPATNAMLVAHSDGVASRSLHMDGKAIDIRVPGRELGQVHAAAMMLRSGGVGYYPKSDFVHVDVGRVRHW